MQEAFFEEIIADSQQIKDHIKQKLGYNAQVSRTSNLEIVSPHYDRLVKALDDAEKLK